MQRKKEKFIGKLVKKDYNNKLEMVLEKKYFSESTKNILLSILYKLEISYKDYKQVKQNVETKEKMIENLINEINRNCDEIKLIKPNSEESDILHGKSFLVDKNRRIIFCYPVERKLLYAISKISKNEKIIKDKYFIINETLSDLINIGNNINKVEPIRDFNGYSWSTITSEIENVDYNLIYQNLLILVGNVFLDKWVKNKEAVLDYMELFVNEMTKLYEKETANKFIKELNEISILLEMKYDKAKRRNIVSDKREAEEELYEMKDNKAFIAKTTKEKRRLEVEIDDVDKILNNKIRLQKEYNKRNEKLPLNEKIFSIRVLAQIMKKERKEKIIRLNELNRLLNPQSYTKYKKNTENKVNLLKITETKDIPLTIEKQKLEIQKTFLKCFQYKIENAKTKQEMQKIIYEFRYYTMLPYDSNKRVREVKELLEIIESLENEILNKAHKMKIIEKFSKQEEINHELLKGLFSTRSINLEDVYVMLEKKKDQYFVQVYDDKMLEDKYELQNVEILNKRALYIRFNKKVKIFC